MHIIINSLSIIILSFSTICLCDHNYIMFLICFLISTFLQIFNEQFIIRKLVQPSKKNAYKIKENKQ